MRLFYLSLVTRVQKNLHQLKEEAVRWRGIIGIEHERARFNRFTYIPSAMHTTAK